jgi:predicted aldo/keto reductase-like oxidoreductase
VKRRPFLKIVGGIAGSCSIGTQSSIAEVLGFKNREANTCEIPLRELGRTGEKLPTVVFPGLCLKNYEQDHCTKELHRFCEAGLNFFDVAPAYGKDGECEKKMGIGLQGLERSRYFLSCKTMIRDKDGARKELERSLQRLQTDYFDLYQLHYIRFPDEVKKALGPGGAMETILKAKEEGKIRYIGFSSHTTKGALEALKQFKFDTVMFPIDYVDYYSFGFGKEVLDEAEKQGVGVLAMKALCGGKWPKDTPPTRDWWYRTIEEPEEVDLAIRFSLSQKPVVAAIPPSFLDLYEKSLTAAKAFRPITEAELERLKGMAAKWESVFLDQQKQVSMGRPHHDLAFPDSPHECGHYV